MADAHGYLVVWALFAFVVLAGVATVVLRTSAVERRSAKADVEWNESFWAAEAGMQQVLAWATDTLVRTLVTGDSLDLGWRSTGGSASYRAFMHRVDNNTGQRFYALRVIGRGSGLFRSQTQLLLHLTEDDPILNVPGALTLINGGAADSLRLDFNGNSFLNRGSDTAMPSAGLPGAIPPGCSAAPTTENKSGISLSSPSSDAETNSSLSGQQRDNVQGLSPGSTTNQYTNVASFEYNNGPGRPYDVSGAELQAMVNGLLPVATNLPPGNHTANLGTPANPGLWNAGNGGSFQLHGSGVGYGVLIVTGDLTMTGSYRWEGIILVVGNGRFDLTGPGSTVHGAVYVANTKGGRTELTQHGNGTIIYSSQAICRAQRRLWGTGVLRLVPVEGRAWSQRF